MTLLCNLGLHRYGNPQERELTWELESAHIICVYRECVHCNYMKVIEYKMKERKETV